MYSDELLTIQERREYILGAEPITDADILPIDELLDVLAAVLDECMNFCNPEQAGIDALLRDAGRAYVALKQKTEGQL